MSYVSQATYKCQNTTELVFQKELILMTSPSEYEICHYWYLKEIAFKYEPYI